jgi:UDP-N-acetylmuramoyl-L-alanyl-D-glutamate--2,6-diaminopimelate ligase
MIIPDRAEAIDYAVEISKKNDLILVAGKGHENYQIIGKEKHHFDDTEQLMRFSKD